MGYHAWLQWLLDRQLAEASRAIPILQDLPIGMDPGGADAWEWQDLLAKEMVIGAPPDAFNADGQDWQLPPFVPAKLRAAAYEPFIQTIRAALRHAGGLRIDHVMGLFRLWWIPNGQHPRKGWYVRYPADDLLGIVALESHRAGAFIVGEDLGTVEPGVRQRLALRRMLSCRLLWFEDRPPAEYPELSMASVTTHDLPTIAGLWSGADEAAQRSIGLTVGDEMRQLRDHSAADARRGKRCAGCGGDRAGLSPAGPGPVADHHRHARRRPGDAAAAQHARHDRPVAQLVAGLAAGHRDDGRGRVAAADCRRRGKGQAGDGKIG